MVDQSTPLHMAPELARKLAELNGAERPAIEAAIALWPLAHRLALVAYGAIDTPEGADFALTEEGLRIIEACATWHEDAERARDLVTAAGGS